MQEAAISEIQKKIDGMLEEQREITKKFQSQAQNLFKEITKEFFEKNPGITAFKWAQYTPYFNDGDTCEFGVNAPTFTNLPEDQLNMLTPWGEYDEDDEEDEYWATDNIGWVLESDSQYYTKMKAKIKKTQGIDLESVKYIGNLIESREMESIMLAMFGDHVTVTATRDGFDVDHLEHD